MGATTEDARVSSLSDEQRQRGMDRERIEALSRSLLTDSYVSDLQQKLRDFLPPNSTEPTAQAMAELASEGFLYTLETFQEKLAEFTSALPEDTDPDDYAELFLRHLLMAELDAYIARSDAKEQTAENPKLKFHTNYYTKLKELCELDEKIFPLSKGDTGSGSGSGSITASELVGATPEIKELREAQKQRRDLFTSLQPLMAQHNENARYRENSARVSFLQQNNMPVPQEFIEKMREEYKYENWDGKQPLPDVNLKLKNEEGTRAEIRVDNIGVKLAQLHQIMNQTDKNITMDGVPCDKKENPFRDIVFEFGDPVQKYTLISVFDKNGFRVMPCLLSDMESGKPKVADITGWMKGGKVTHPTEPADMTVAGAQADALRRLAKFALAPAEEATAEVIKTVTRVSRPSVIEEIQPEPIIERQVVEEVKKTEAELQTATIVKATSATAVDEQTAVRSTMPEVPQMASVPKAEVVKPAFIETKKDTQGSVAVAHEREHTAPEMSALHIELPEIITTKKQTPEMSEWPEDDLLSEILRKPQMRQEGLEKPNQGQDTYDEVFKIFNKHSGMTRLEFNALVMNGLRRVNPYERAQGVRQDKDIGQLLVNDETEKLQYPQISVVNQVRGEEYSLTKRVNENATSSDKTKWTGAQIITMVVDGYRNDLRAEAKKKAEAGVTEQPLPEVVEKTRVLDPGDETKAVRNVVDYGITAAIPTDNLDGKVITMEEEIIVSPKKLVEDIPPPPLKEDLPPLPSDNEMEETEQVVNEKIQENPIQEPGGLERFAKSTVTPGEPVIIGEEQEQQQEEKLSEEQPEKQVQLQKGEATEDEMQEQKVEQEQQQEYQDEQDVAAVIEADQEEHPQEKSQLKMTENEDEAGLEWLNELDDSADETEVKEDTAARIAAIKKDLPAALIKQNVENLVAILEHYDYEPGSLNEVDHAWLTVENVNATLESSALKVGPDGQPTHDYQAVISMIPEREGALERTLSALQSLTESANLDETPGIKSMIEAIKSDPRMAVQSEVEPERELMETGAQENPLLAEIRNAGIKSLKKAETTSKQEVENDPRSSLMNQIKNAGIESLKKRDPDERPQHDERTGVATSTTPAPKGNSLMNSLLQKMSSSSSLTSNNKHDDDDENDNDWHP